VGLGPEAAGSAEDAELMQIRERVSFRHPLVRSAVYGAGDQHDRRLAHDALARATDAAVDPDRRAWHRAQATAGPDEDVAAELVRTSSRAKSRGGLAAAGAFLARAAMLTPDPTKRAERFLTAAEVMFEAAAFVAVDELLGTIDTDRLDDHQAARAERIHACIALSRDPDDEEAIRDLVAAAERLGPRDRLVAYGAQLQALTAAYDLQRPELMRAIATSLAMSPTTDSGAAVELIIGACQRMLEVGRKDPMAAYDLFRQAAIALRDKPQLEELDLRLFQYADTGSRGLFDFDLWETLVRRMLQLARGTGALRWLPPLLGEWADVKCAEGAFSEAAAALAEAEAIAEATGAGPDWQRVSLRFLSWHFEETEALARLDANVRRMAYSPPLVFASQATIYNAAGRYADALAAGQHSRDVHPLGTSTASLPEIVEAAVRLGQPDRATAAFDFLVTVVGTSEWGMGLAARSNAMLSDDAATAERLYREAIERLERARTRPDLARAYLVYGEWLRRENRRLDAREALRTAYELFIAMGIPVFADRARRELAATGEIARKHSDDKRVDLTAQETQISRLASGGLTNSEIAAQLFLSPRTVEWHLRQVFSKLGITSRRELRAALGSAV
jgi:DNA-binding CsgD family transcriptional regulator/tetratricopeptide (TPR) repeat protein